MRRKPIQNPLLALLALLALQTGLLAPPAAAQGVPIGFSEDFALAADREKALEQLIPGTEDYYYYHCLHRQNQGRFAEVEGLLATWIERHGRGGRVPEIENRQALMTYDLDPSATLDFLQRRMGLGFNHQREVEGEKPDLPVRLDPALISHATLTRRALLSHPGSVDGFRDQALEYLVGRELDEKLLMSLLSRLQRPDVPNLPALVVRNLASRSSRGFGSLTIHQNLLLDQLEECAGLMPALINEAGFITAYLARLAPNPDVEWRRDAAAREDYLERLQGFVGRLAPTHNSIKAHVLHHRLVHDLALGAPDKARFMAYLRLPRRTSYVNPRLSDRVRANEIADLDQGFPTGFEPVRNDEPLVRAYLAHFFASEGGYQPYRDYVREEYLSRLFAETRILAGSGDMERWYSMLDDPAYYEALKERVEIEFPPTQQTYFAAAEPVTVEADVKNVDTLLVKVFEINTLNYYSDTGREVDASINLDGLIANEERTYTYGENPLRRVRRTFELPTLARPGVYVVELIGNGLSSRAVIRKGRLQYQERLGSAGHVFRVLDESGVHQPKSSILFAGREYPADEHGEIVVPYSTDPDVRTILLRAGGLTSIEQFRHEAEHYDLHAGIFVEREALIPGRKALILVRPSLRLNGRAVSLDLLEEPVLTITSRDQDGVASSLDVRDFELSAEREYVHEIQVPEGLASLGVTLRGKVQNLSTDQKVDVAASARELLVDAIDQTPQTAAPLLSRTREGYVVEVLGKSGEPIADRAVDLRLQHRDFTDPVPVTLKTDERGRIHLGALEGIESVQASGLPGGYGPWRLDTDDRSYPRRIHGEAGRTLRVPYHGAPGTTSRAAVSLLEVRNGAFVRDAVSHAALAGGYVELRGLPPGDYDLLLKEQGRNILVSVTAGEARGGWAVGRDRMLELQGAPVAVTDAGVEGDQLVVRLRNASEAARLHVFTSRYLPAFDPFAGLYVPTGPDPDVAAVPHPDSGYYSGREIGDEYRYILERRYAARFPGNMLHRPGLLLNPWALEVTNAMIGMGGGAGGAFGGPSGGRRNLRAAGGAGSEIQTSVAPGSFANVGFLPEPSRTLANLEPDADGLVRVPLADLGGAQLVHVVAVDGGDTVYSTVALGRKEIEPRDRRLASALDSERHFVEQKRIEFLDAGGEVVIEGGGTSAAETYDSLASVFQLYLTLSGSGDLSRFAFLLGWPKLSFEEKRELYSRHACHELHFFLYEKDPEFFGGAVRPYLANKAHKTFLDHWLLGHDLARYLDPWRFQQLNVVERILLARRIEGEREAGARHLRELLDLIPEDARRMDSLFHTALRGSALETAESLGKKLAETRVAGRRDAPDAARLREEKAAQAPVAGAAGEPAEEAEVLFDADKEGLDFQDDLRDRAADLARRKQTRSLYRAVEPTREYVEHNYWHRRIDEQDGDMIPVNAFWTDFALADPDAPFFSTSFPSAASSFAEMMLALAVLDLPFEPGEHDVQLTEGRATFRAASPLLLVRKELDEVVFGEGGAPVLLSQNLFRLDDRYRFDGNQRFDKFVTDELLVGIAYGSQVVLTNPTSTPRELELLLQVPEGAIPVQRGFNTRGMPVQVAAYGTATVEYAFYFPRPGAFPHYPAHVGQDGELIAFAEARTLNVVTEPSTVDTTSWEHVSQRGSEEEVLEYLGRANLFRLDLSKIAWRMRDRRFFDSVLAHLRSRHVYDHLLWSYGVRHGDTAAVREYLANAEGFLRGCGRYLDTTLALIDPVERRAYQHVEYEPLFNARAHRFGKRREVLNHDLARQYLTLLDVLAYRPALDATDWMSVTYYMLLQDRVEEALRSFALVEPEELPMRLQFDYMRAYLDFFTDDHAAARGIAEAYAEHPVGRWRAMFQDVLNQLAEAEGGAVAVSDDDSRTQLQTQLAATEPALDLAVEARRVHLRHANLEEVEVRYFEMDIEFLFSTSPFVKQGGGSFAYIRPNRTDVIALAADSRETAFDLPAEFQSSNLLVEVRGGGVAQRQAYYANSLSVQTIESYGQVKVTHAETERPLPKVYVKVFARTGDGTVRFHKDGYTDLRGRFDYASVSGPGSAGAEKFAILVLSEGDGAVIREVEPPVE